jgi:hypothetical protein
MKKIILTASGDITAHRPQRFIVEYDEDLNEAQIVNESAPRVERGRDAFLGVTLVDDHDYRNHGGIRLAVEVAP